MEMQKKSTVLLLFQLILVMTKSQLNNQKKEEVTLSS